MSLERINWYLTFFMWIYVHQKKLASKITFSGMCGQVCVLFNQLARFCDHQYLEGSSWYLKEMVIKARMWEKLDVSCPMNLQYFFIVDIHGRNQSISKLFEFMIFSRISSTSNVQKSCFIFYNLKQRFWKTLKLVSLSMKIKHSWFRYVDLF